MDFGKYSIITNARHALEKEADWWWDFRPVTSKDEVEYARWQDANLQRVQIDGRDVLLQPLGFVAAWRELAISFGGTNIPGEDGEPIIKTGMDVDQIEAVLKEMPGDLILELWSALKESYPFWGPKVSRKEAESAEETSEEAEASEES